LLTVGAVTAALVLLLTACLSSTPLEDLGGNLSRAVAVNEHGVIVGQGLDDNQNGIPVILDPDSGVMSPIPPLTNGSGEALDVNDQGLVVGNSFAELLDCLIPPPVLCPIRVDHAYLYDSTTGTLEDLADFGVGAVPPGSQQIAVGSGATGVSEAGIVVGAATSIGPGTGGAPISVYPRAFAFDSVTDAVTDLSVYGMTSAADINENGQVLGQIGEHAAVVDLATGAVTDIGTFGGTFSQGHALNDEGLVVGSAQVADNSAFHAFVYDLATGVLTDIGTLPQQGAPNSTAYGVNNDGIVVGTSAASGGQHPFAYDVPAKSIKDLGLLGASIHVEARDINDAGTAVGFSPLPPTHAWRATVWRHY
jgi:probable HAF family extracellular repeat protein